MCSWCQQGIRDASRGASRGLRPQHRLARRSLGTGRLIPSGLRHRPPHGRAHGPGLLPQVAHQRVRGVVQTVGHGVLDRPVHPHALRQLHAHGRRSGLQLLDRPGADPLGVSILRDLRVEELRQGEAKEGVSDMQVREQQPGLRRPARLGPEPLPVRLPTAPQALGEVGGVLESVPAVFDALLAQHQQTVRGMQDPEARALHVPPHGPIPEGLEPRPAGVYDRGQAGVQVDGEGLAPNERDLLVKVHPEAFQKRRGCLPEGPVFVLHQEIFCTGKGVRGHHEVDVSGPPVAPVPVHRVGEHRPLEGEAPYARRRKQRLDPPHLTNQKFVAEPGRPGRRREPRLHIVGDAHGGQGRQPPAQRAVDAVVRGQRQKIFPLILFGGKPHLPRGLPGKRVRPDAVEKTLEDRKAAVRH